MPHAFDLKHQASSASQEAISTAYASSQKAILHEQPVKFIMSIVIAYAGGVVKAIRLPKFSGIDRYN